MSEPLEEQSTKKVNQSTPSVSKIAPSEPKITVSDFLHRKESAVLHKRPVASMAFERYCQRNEKSRGTLAEFQELLAAFERGE